MNEKDISQIINELGEDRESYFQAVTPPIFQTSNFGFLKVADFRNAMMAEPGTYIYTSRNNPTRDLLAKKLAALDHAEDCLVVNSGTAAIFVSVMAHVKPGDHIVSVENPYNWAHRLMSDYLPELGITTTFVDGRDIHHIKDAIRQNTTLIYLESPNSWTFYLQDLEAIARFAKQKNILTICDNSYATPLYQRPLELGVDITIQSATKYLNGHSDVIAGVICSSKSRIDKMLNSEYLYAGLGISPFNAWLVLRGLRTLPARLNRIAQTTRQVVDFLKSCDEIESISFPMDPDFPQYGLSQKQMSDAGGLFSFVLKNKGPKDIEAFCNALQHILMAVSWGGHESLIMPALATMNATDFDPGNEAHRRIRFYTGLEDAAYIIEDLKRGFEAIG